jgi:hypothetical protein
MCGFWTNSIREEYDFISGVEVNRWKLLGKNEKLKTLRN